MKHFFLILFFASANLIAQVGVNTVSPQGALDVVSVNNTGLVLPRVSSTSVVTTPDGSPLENGPVVYDVSLDAVCFYIHGTWDCKRITANGGIENTIPYTEKYTYIKSSNPDINDGFGQTIAISADGNTLIVGSSSERSLATGVNGDGTNNGGVDVGAAYVYTRNAGTWEFQAYLKAQFVDSNDQFGYRVAISDDGNSVVIAAIGEDSNASGVNGDASNNFSSASGAAYIFTRSGSTWSQVAFLKASNNNGNDGFGRSVSISGDGNTVAVGAANEDSNAVGIGGNQFSNTATNSGAMYIFKKNAGIWSQETYIKASNTGSFDYFGFSSALNTTGNTLVVGAYQEDSSATGTGGNQTDNSSINSGAAYVFERVGMNWSQQTYIKAGNTDADDEFARTIAISGNGDRIVVGARWEDSNATNVNGANNNNATQAGAAYIYKRTGTIWNQEAYVKANNTEISDLFADSVSISANGLSVLIGAIYEDSDAKGIDNDWGNNNVSASGSAYLYVFNGSGWEFSKYIKASNTNATDLFGGSVALNSDGSVLAIGATGEESSAAGVNGDQLNNNFNNAGATYIIEE